MGDPMAKVVVGMTLSLDGFVNDRNGSVARLYPDLAALAKTDESRQRLMLRKPRTASGTNTARSAATQLPPIFLTLGLIVPVSDLSRGVIFLAFVLSGGLIGSWWAPIPSVVTWTALAAAEEANHWGFGPGTRFGTAIEIHSGGDFSVWFFALTTAVAIALPTVGLLARVVASTLLRRIRRAG